VAMPPRPRETFEVGRCTVRSSRHQPVYSFSYSRLAWSEIGTAGVRAQLLAIQTDAIALLEGLCLSGEIAAMFDTPPIARSRGMSDVAKQLGLHLAHGEATAAATNRRTPDPLIFQARSIGGLAAKQVARGFSLATSEGNIGALDRFLALAGKRPGG
jgi:hypothetical protein